MGFQVSKLPDYLNEEDDWSWDIDYHVIKSQREELNTQYNYKEWKLLVHSHND